MIKGNQKSDQVINPSRYEGEIDLSELIAVLWNGKWIVIATVLLLAIPAFVFLKMMPSVYRIDTIIDQTSNYRLQRIQPSKLESGEAYQVQSIELGIVYSTALAHANSLYVKRLYWQDLRADKSTILSELNEVESKQLFKEFADHLSVTVPDVSKSGASMLSVLSLEGEDSVYAGTLLGTYLEFVDQHTIGELTDQLRAGYATSLLRLEADYQSLFEREQQQLEDHLVRLEEAFDLAKSLGIVETPYEQVENVELTILDNREYLLGTKVIGEEINSMKARKDKPLAAFVRQLRDMEHWKEQLDRDLKRLDGAPDVVHAFVIVSPPESSIDPVKPNKLLILIAVLFLAGILGVVIVFTREGIKSYKARGTE